MNLFRVVILTLLALIAACAANPKHIKNPHPNMQGANTKEDVDDTLGGVYHIGVDDVLQISVWRNPELSVVVPVRPDGQISVPLIGDVRAGGLTAMQVATSIKEKLAFYVRDPNVAVILTQLRSHEFLSRVRVIGAVRNPMTMPYRQGMTVLDAVLEAGSTNDFAAPNRTKLHRKEGEKTKVISIPLGDILTNGSLDSNIDLQPGDIISVPERLF